MRLTDRQTAAIKQAVAEVLRPGAQVWLFGSRADDSARGSDIDLLVRPDPAAGRSTLMDKVRLLGRLENEPGERRIDIVIEAPDDRRTIVQTAHETAIRL